MTSEELNWQRNYFNDRKAEVLVLIDQIPKPPLPLSFKKKSVLMKMKSPDEKKPDLLSQASPSVGCGKTKSI
jgi:hypothetical protein